MGRITLHDGQIRYDEAVREPMLSNVEPPPSPSAPTATSSAFTPAATAATALSAAARAASATTTTTGRSDMRRVNVFEPDIAYDESRPAGYRTGTARIGPALGAHRIAATVYELPPGQSTWPYHYEHGAEEWVLVLEGAPTLQAPGRGGPARAWRRRVLRGRPRGRSQAHEPRRAHGTADDPVDHGPTRGGRVPGQRQARGLARPGRAALVRRERVDYWDGEA